MFGCVWICLDMFRDVWIFLNMFGCDGICSNMFRYMGPRCWSDPLKDISNQLSSWIMDHAANQSENCPRGQRSISRVCIFDTKNLKSVLYCCEYKHVLLAYSASRKGFLPLISMSWTKPLYSWSTATIRVLNCSQLYCLKWPGSRT